LAQKISSQTDLFNFAKKHRAYIGIGSNMGDKRWHCLSAMDLLSEISGTTIVKRSSLYKSEAIGPGVQDWYVNAVVEIETSLPPQELLAALHVIEMQHARQRTVVWGPRTLDLDILFYDGLILSETQLTLPHPEAHQRHFVLMPLHEIAPRLIHPVFKETIANLLRDTPCKTACFPLREDVVFDQKPFGENP